MNRILPLLALLSVAASTYAAQAQVYKWTDAAGVVHYSDAPPPKNTPQVETMRVKGGLATASAGADAGDKPKDATAANSPPPNAGIPDTPDNRSKECQTARNNLALLQSGAAVNVVGADGKAQAVTDQDRQARIDGVKDRIAQYCQ